jgi:hypothetical protein
VPHEVKINDIPLRMSIMIDYRQTTVILTNYHDARFWAMLRRMGATIVAVKVEDKEYERRKKQREDLRTLKFNLSDINWNNADHIVKDFDGLLHDLNAPIASMGFGGEIVPRTKYMPVSRHFHEHGGFGVLIRYVLYLGLARRGLGVVDLGAEIDSVMTANKVRGIFPAFKSSHYGLPESVPYTKEGEAALELISRLNFIETPPHALPDDVFCSTFAISNYDNPSPPHVLSQFASLGKFVFMFPSKTILTYKPPGMNDDYFDGTSLHSRRLNPVSGVTRVYRDHTLDEYSIMQYGYDVYSAVDLYVLLTHDENGNRLTDVEREYYDTIFAGPLWSTWTFVTSPGLFRYHSLQTWEHTQTLMIRSPAGMMRHHYAVNDDTLHVFRRAAVHFFAEIQNLRVASFDWGDRVNGGVIRNGHKYWIATSGHIINLLLLTSYQVIDLKKQLDFVERNVELYTSGKSGKFKLRPEERSIMRSSNITEVAIIKVGHLWHSYSEYQVGLITYLQMVKTLKLSFNPHAFRYCQKRLEQIRRRYPRFDSDMGQQAYDFSRSPEANLPLSAFHDPRTVSKVLTTTP